MDVHLEVVVWNRILSIAYLTYNMWHIHELPRVQRSNAAAQISAPCTLTRAQRVAQHILPGRLPVTPLPPTLSLSKG